jgi:hypothetical protein
MGQQENCGKPGAKTGKRQRLRTGVKQALKKLRGGLNPEIGKKTQFQPGDLRVQIFPVNQASAIRAFSARGRDKKR